VLAVVDDVDTELGLAAHHRRDGVADAPFERAGVDGFAGIARVQRLEQLARARQAADVGSGILLSLCFMAGG
jgi:hypothetical protein